MQGKPSAPVWTIIFASHERPPMRRIRKRTNKPGQCLDLSSEPRVLGTQQTPVGSLKRRLDQSDTPAHHVRAACYNAFRELLVMVLETYSRSLGPQVLCMASNPTQWEAVSQ